MAERKVNVMQYRPGGKFHTFWTYCGRPTAGCGYFMHLDHFTKCQMLITDDRFCGRCRITIERIDTSEGE